MQQGIKLRPYQTECLDAVYKAEKSGSKRQLICLPTGTGKTRLFNELIRQRNEPTLIIAHANELIKQALDKLLEVWPDVDYGIVKRERDEHNHQVVLASKQTLQYQSRLDRFPSDKFKLVVTDEAHHAAADGYQRIYKHLNIKEGGDVLHIGVTATPNRTDKKELYSTFDECVYNKSLLEMINKGWLCDLQCRLIQTDVDITGARRGKDYDPDELAALIDTKNCNELIVRAFKKYANERSAIIFCASVGHARSLAVAFQGAGINAQALFHRLPDAVRDGVINGYAKEEIQIVTNFNILTEGYDNPRTDCIIIARPTSSNLLYTQMIGRGTRTHPEKSDCLIMDVACISNHKDILALPTLFGLEKPPDDGEGVAKTVRLRPNTKTAPEPIEDIGTDVHSKWIDLFGRSKFAWVKIANGYALGLGIYGTLLLKRDAKDALKYDVILDKKKARKTLTERPMSLEWAQGIAEDHAREITEGRSELINKDAEWRQEKPTPKQIQILTKRRIRIKPGLTKGEASDIISRMFADNMATQKQISALRRLSIPFNPNTLTKGQAGRMLADAAKGRK